MYFSGYLFVVLISIMEVKPNDVSSRFKKAGLVPKVIPNAPEMKLCVIYNQNKEVNFGTKLTFLDTLLQPIVSWDADPDCIYTLIMFDPDALFPQFSLPGQLLHWMVANIKCNDLDTGDVIAIYESPTPPPLSSPHRYVLLVYKQKCYVRLDDLTTITRVNFNITDFSSKHDLEGPVFGNFFLEQFDFSINILF
ncbi:protein D2-like [Pectinophora gossypiella]|uniref:protein D2-like n=1 Tax=Pectinophora gossypiella TaxID=13191 RepID=UPI00214F46F1|nr:protein D2-like [Pectinophora gossypiella]